MLVAIAFALPALLSWAIPTLGMVGAHAAAPLVAPVVAGAAAAGAGALLAVANAVGSIGEEDASKTQRISNSKCEKVQYLLIFAKKYDESLSSPHIGHEEEHMLLKENYETALGELLEKPRQEVSGMNDKASLLATLKKETEHNNNHIDFVMQLANHFQCE
jgi:hypothetical protein